jgi:hypothetical protein
MSKGDERGAPRPDLMRKERSPEEKMRLVLEESQDLAADLIERATGDENVPENTLVLHADNGGR